MRPGIEQLTTARELVRCVIERYRDRWPGIAENYTLVLLLVIRERGVFIPTDAIEAAARGELPNLTTVHRALTIVKKLYQTGPQAARSAELQQEWREVLSGVAP